MLDLFKDLRFPLGPFPEARFTSLSCDFPNQDEGEVVYNYNQEHKEVHEDINFSDRLSNRQTEAQRRLKILKQVCAPVATPRGLAAGVLRSRWRGSDTHSLDLCRLAGPPDSSSSLGLSSGHGHTPPRRPVVYPVGQMAAGGKAGEAARGLWRPPEQALPPSIMTP